MVVENTVLSKVSVGQEYSIFLLNKFNIIQEGHYTFPGVICFFCFHLKVFPNMFAFTAKVVFYHFKSLFLSELCEVLMEISIVYTNYFNLF